MATPGGLTMMMQHTTAPRSTGDASLPAGTYILNNGPKRKGQGGRFTMGTHAALKQLMKDVPGITFTEKPEKADFVILPEGVREPGHKLTRRNPALKDPRNVFSMDQIAHVMRSEGYVSSSKRHHRSSRAKHGLMYTTKDAKGRDVQIDIPSNLETDDPKFTQTISKISSASVVRIPEQDYPVVRRVLRGPPAPAVVPVPPIPVAATPLVLPDKSVQIAQKISELDALLGTLQQNAPPPLEPMPQPMMAPAPFTMPVMPTTPVIPVTPIIPAAIQQQGSDAALDKVREEVKDAVVWLKDTTIYGMPAPDDAFTASTRPHDNSRFIVTLLNRMDTLRYRLEVLLFVRGETQTADTEQRKSIAKQDSDRNIRNVQSGLERIKRGMPVLERAIESVQSMQQTDPTTLRSVIVQMIADILKTVEVATFKNQSYREATLTDIRQSRAGMACTKQNAICQDEDLPERVEFILYAMFNSACEIVSNLQWSGMSTSSQVVYRAMCKNLELVSATVCDIYNYLYLVGFENDTSPERRMKCGSGENVCQNLYRALEDCLTAFRAVKPDGAQLNIPRLLGHLQIMSAAQIEQKDEVSRASTFWKTQRGQPTLYNLFYRFLIRADPETNRDQLRSDAFATMQSQMNTLLVSGGADKAREAKKFYAYTSLVSLFFVLANFCSGADDGRWFWRGSGTGKFTVEEIKAILKQPQYEEVDSQQPQQPLEAEEEQVSETTAATYSD